MSNVVDSVGFGEMKEVCIQMVFSRGLKSKEQKDEVQVFVGVPFCNCVVRLNPIVGGWLRTNPY